MVPHFQRGGDRSRSHDTVDAVTSFVGRQCAGEKLLRRQQDRIGIGLPGNLPAAGAVLDAHEFHDAGGGLGWCGGGGRPIHTTHDGLCVRHLQGACRAFDHYFDALVAGHRGADSQHDLRPWIIARDFVRHPHGNRLIESGKRVPSSWKHPQVHAP